MDFVVFVAVDTQTAILRAFQATGRNVCCCRLMLVETNFLIFEQVYIIKISIEFCLIFNVIS